MDGPGFAKVGATLAWSRPMKRSALPAVLLAVACLACAPALDARAQSVSAAPAAPAAPAAQSPWHQPRPGLYTGGQPAPVDWAALKALGVTMVVNLRPDAEMAGR